MVGLMTGHRVLYGGVVGPICIDHGKSHADGDAVTVSTIGREGSVRRKRDKLPLTAVRSSIVIMFIRYRF